MDETSGLKVVKPGVRRWPFVVIVVVGLLAGGLVYNYSRPLEKLRFTETLTPLGTTTPQLAWPTEGTAAISANGYDFVASHGDPHATFSTASLIKLVLALCVLEKYPLTAGDQGPTLTMTADDVARMRHEAATQGNHIDIVVGEKMSLYHTLEAVLIESSNSTANTLAIWAFGSQDAYKTYAANWLKTHDMSETTLGNDASGTDPANASTLSDLLKLGRIAFVHPIIRQIVSTPTAVFQTHGTIYNRNKLLDNGILLGGKTGSLDDIKGSYLFLATTKNVTPGADVTLVGVAANDTSVQQAIEDSEALAKSAAGCFENITLARAGDTVGSLSSSWGKSTPVTVTKDLTISRWCGSAITVTQTVRDYSAQTPGEIGTITAEANGKNAEAPLAIAHTVEQPTVLWRATRLP